MIRLLVLLWCGKHRGRMFSIQRAMLALPKPTQRDVREWTSLISSHLKQGHPKEALRLYFEMHRAGVKANAYLYVAALKACSSPAALAQGRHIHSHIIAHAFECNLFVCTALIHMYARCNSLEHARLCFDHTPHKDLVSWNAMIGGYTRHGLGKQAFGLFETMQKEGIRPDFITFVNLLKACSSPKFLEKGRQFHAEIISRNLESDLRVGNSLIDMYGKCGSIDEACRVFETMPKKDDVSWNSMIGGYILHGLGAEALGLFAEMDCRGVKPNNVTFKSILKACGSVGEGKEIHAQIIHHGLHLDPFIGSSLVRMYADCGSFDLALKVFYSLPVRDLVLWNTIITGFAQHGHGEHAIELFGKMQREGISPDGITYASILKACGSTSAIDLGRAIHAQLSKFELQADCILANALMDMYVKSGNIDEARQVFDKLQPHREVSSYNVMIAGYGQLGLYKHAVQVFEIMKEQGIVPNVVTFVSVLKAYSGTGCLDTGKLIHAQILEQGYEEDLHVSRSLIDMYFRCDGVDEACRIFMKLPVRDASVWNTLFGGYVQHGLDLEALQAFDEMRWSGTMPDCGTFATVLKACSNLQAIARGNAIHAQIIEMGLHLNLSVGNSLIDMYGQCGSLDEACEVFDSLPVKDAVSWNVLITGYVENGLFEQAMKLFDRMQLKKVPPDLFTFLSILKACGAMMDRQYGQSIHKLIIQTNHYADNFIGSALIDMYIKCNSFKEANEVFDSFVEKDVVLWNVILRGYVHGGLGHEALGLFKRMLQEGVRPNWITFLSILKACGDAAFLNQGKFIHGHIIESGVEQNLVVGNALIDMYCNCGSLSDAQHLFDSLSSRDLVSWNALLAGFAQHGHAEQALACFGKMLQEGFKPNEATFSSLLSACSHASALEDGFLFFHSISNQMSSLLRRQHYACMVDLLCRAGNLSEAVKFVHMMPTQPDAVMLMSILAACQIHRAAELGRHCFECILKLDSRNTAAYVVMSNIYASSGRWEDRAEVRSQMDMAAVVKTVSGCTWIECNQ